MNEMWDVAAVADQFAAAGIAPNVTVRLAQAVRSNGAAAVHSLGAGAFSWKTTSALNELITTAFDGGATGQAIAAELELVAQLQSMLQHELALL